MDSQSNSVHTPPASSLSSSPSSFIDPRDMDCSVEPDFPDDDDATSMAGSRTSEHSPARKKKRKSWGQVLPEPTTNLPPRKRAKTDAEKQQRKYERVQRNRQAAHNSRMRKQEEMNELLDRNTALESRCKEQEKHIACLEQQLRSLQGQPLNDSCPLTPPLEPITLLDLQPDASSDHLVEDLVDIKPIISSDHLGQTLIDGKPVNEPHSAVDVDRANYTVEAWDASKIGDLNAPLDMHEITDTFDQVVNNDCLTDGSFMNDFSWDQSVTLEDFDIKPSRTTEASPNLDMYHGFTFTDTLFDPSDLNPSKF